MKQLIVAGLAISSLILRIGDASAANLIIDRFNDVNNSAYFDSSADAVYMSIVGNQVLNFEGNLVQSPPPAQNLETGLTGTIGGSRSIDFNTITPLGNATLYIDPSTGFEILAVENDPDTNSIAEITWNQGLTNLSNLYDRFRLTISFLDVSTSIQLRVNSGGSQAVLERTFDTAITSPTPEEFLFSDFQGDLSVFDNPSSIVMTITGGVNNTVAIEGWDAAIELVEAVEKQPEPPVGVPEPSLWLGITVVAGIEFLSRKGKSL